MFIFQHTDGRLYLVPVRWYGGDNGGRSCNAMVAVSFSGRGKLREAHFLERRELQKQQ